LNLKQAVKKQGKKVVAVAFDFDGTLVLSNQLKKNIFVDIIKTKSDKEKMRKLVESARGDRYAILNKFAKNQAQRSQLKMLYDSEYIRRMSICRYRKNANLILNYLNAKETPIFINSATPKIILRKIVEIKFPKIRFSGVHGGYAKKVENLKKIKSKTKFQVTVIGDGLDDRQAAKRAKCHFVGVDGGGLSRTDSDYRLVKDLMELKCLLT
jgi:phosphoglycolate phosphatase-like HAD superfamily hydrolase